MQPTKKLYGVFFERLGYAQIEANSSEEALQIANTQLKLDDISWDDDWRPTDIQEEYK